MNEHLSETKRRLRVLISTIIIIIIVAFFYYTSIQNYLVFHTLVEFVSIAIAVGLFMLSWNSQQFNTNRYIIFLGIAFLFISGLDLVHMMAYKGMNILGTDDANLPTQLWISARYLEGITFLIAPFMIKKVFNPTRVFILFSAVFLVLLAITLKGMFPTCYIEGIGLTPFKKISEYIISILLLISLALLYKNRDYFEKSVISLLYLSIVVTIISEIAFTFYISVYGISNFIGHIFKVISYYLIYKAVIETGLKKPYLSLFRVLEQSEEKYRSLFDHMITGFALHKIVTDNNGKPIDYIFIDVNNPFEKITGLKKENIIGKSVIEVIPGTENDSADWIGKYGKVALDGAELSFENFSESINKWFSIMAFSPKKEYFATIFEDITDRKQIEEKIKFSRERLKIINKTLRHDLANDLVVIQSATKLYKRNPDNKMLDEIEERVEKSLTTIIRLREQESYFNSRTSMSKYELREVLNSFIGDYPALEIKLEGEGTAFADEAIYSVFENLINNSIIHGKTKELKIEISADEKFCKIRFADFGKGMPTDIMEKIFDEGFMYGETGHTGIGLYIVEQTIKGYGGTITVENNLPTGVIFVIRLRKVV